MFRKFALAILVMVACLVRLTSAAAQAQQLFNEQLLKAITFRNVGPFRIGARIAAIAVPASPARAHQDTIYVAPWTGGLFKSTNNGTTWKPIFDNQSARLTVGAVALAPSNPDIVWVGTGDAFTSRSSYAGDGVYKSTDAGKTWTHMGLDDSQHIARIAIDPANPDVVYVAAMGHLYSDNAERGVFKTTDSGRTWKKVLYINDKVGVIDLVMDPKNPSVLYAASYDEQRLPWKFVDGGPDSAIYKTTDAGAHWTKLTKGLPRGRIGRIGLALYPKNPDIVYALIENANPRAPTKKEVEKAQRVGRPRPRPEIGGQVYRTMDAGASWTQMNPHSVNISEKGPYYFSQIFVDPDDYQHIFTTGVSLGNSTDGGRTWHDLKWPPKRLFKKIFGDVRTLWIDPENPDRMLLGSDGGVYETYDGGKTADHFPNLPIQQVYEIAVDNAQPFNIYVGIQDHENWKGVSNGPQGYVDTWDWRAVGNGDGIFTVPDPTNSRWIYTTEQYGGQARVDQKLGLRQSIQPVRHKKGKPSYRFIWSTPIVVSPHDSQPIYTGAQMLLKSVDRGEHWREISPDLSMHPAGKILPNTEGGIPGGIPWFAISAIAVSPVTPGLIWVGTSDGRVWVTRDAGAHWNDRTAAVEAAGANLDAFVSRFAASPFDASTAFVTKSGYKLDDFHPYIYKTTDYGKIWTSIAGDLPQEPINLVVQDPVNPSLLFVGNDAGLFVSIDGGARWVRVTNVPNVPVRALALQKRDKSLVVGTFGRSVFVADIGPLEELSESLLSQNVHFFDVQPTVQRVPWQFGANDYLFGNRHIVTPNAPNGMRIEYYLKDAAPNKASVTITDAYGHQVAQLKGPAKSGLNMVVWNTHRHRSDASEHTDSFHRDGSPLDRLVAPGDYTVTLRVDNQTITRKAQIIGTQGWSIGPQPRMIH